MTITLTLTPTHVLKVAELAEQVEEASSAGPGPGSGFTTKDYHYTAANEGEGVELGTYSDREGSGRGSGGTGGCVELLLPKGREAIANRSIHQETKKPRHQYIFAFLSQPPYSNA